MAKRVAALATVLLCALAVAVAAAGLPALSVEPADSGGPVESENATIDSGGGSFSGKDNETYSMFGDDDEEGNATEAMIASLIQGATGGLPSGFGGSEDQSSGSAERSPETSLLDGPAAVLGVVAVAVVAAALTLRRASGSVDETAESAGEGADAHTEAAAAAAGRAADAVEAADGDESDLSNAVYRAWYEMTAALDVADPETATPGEFADAARAAGLDPDAVADLTAVFEAVRYGDEPVADHEERALAALRQIERDADIDAGADGGADLTENARDGEADPAGDVRDEDGAGGGDAQ